MLLLPCVLHRWQIVIKRELLMLLRHLLTWHTATFLCYLQSSRLPSVTQPSFPECSARWLCRSRLSPGLEGYLLADDVVYFKDLTNTVRLLCKNKRECWESRVDCSETARQINCIESVNIYRLLDCRSCSYFNQFFLACCYTELSYFLFFGVRSRK